MIIVDGKLTFDPVQVSTNGGSDLVKNIQNEKSSFNTQDGDIYLFATDPPPGRTPKLYIMQGNSALQKQLDGTKYGLDAGETRLVVFINDIVYILSIKVTMGMSGDTWNINDIEVKCPNYHVLKILPLKAEDTAPAAVAADDVASPAAAPAPPAAAPALSVAVAPATAAPALSVADAPHDVAAADAPHDVAAADDDSNDDN